jgi:hypothetical protein
MPKKIKPVRKSKDKSLRLTIVSMGVFLLLVGVAVFFQKPEDFCANSISCIKDLSGKKEATNDGVFMGKTVYAPNTPDTPEFALSQANAVLGDATGVKKHIYVDLTNQQLFAYEGNKVVYHFPVSTGKWHATPTGDFKIWVWLRYTRMSGGDPAKGTYYNLPNVPYTMYFYNDSTPKNWGFSLHGAYWHNNFGHVMSHGCVNLKPEDAGKIFNWSTPGSGYTSYPTADNQGPIITIFGTPNPAETAFID